MSADLGNPDTVPIPSRDGPRRARPAPHEWGAFAVSTVWLATLLAAPDALAQEFERVEGQVRETIPAAPFLAGAYGFIWAAVLVYVVLVARRLGAVKADIEELRRRVQPPASRG